MTVNGLHIALDFAPLAPFAWLAALALMALAIGLYSIVARARGAWMRVIAFAILVLALANPIAVEEKRDALPDIVALVTDRSQSMDTPMGGQSRATAARTARDAMRGKLRALGNIEIREAEAASTGNDGTRLFGALSSALADVPPNRVAGAILITDGEAHDAPALESGQTAPFARAPVHGIIVGARNERDRKLTVVNAARFAIVGQDADLTLRVDDFTGETMAATGEAGIRIRVDGGPVIDMRVPVGRSAPVKIPVTHGGENIVEIEAAPGPNELTLQNNRAVVTVTGVRDRLRVLLVSGEPHAGERVWRNLLKADASVDLVHFTILRPPDKQDSTPISELSLIAFPTRELFQEKLSAFDLVIFDRYSERGILPFTYFANIADYVENGGALLVASGPEFAGPMSIARTPLAAILPAQPNGEIVSQGFRPIVTPQGEAHPVTQGLPGSNADGRPPTWGRWFRTIGAERVAGETVMAGPGERPLLVLGRVGKGRVAELMSDHAWLWARGFEGGGPQAELLRRLAHWLMKEPELEEERLAATAGSGALNIERRTMAAAPAPVSVTAPSGARSEVALQKSAPGVWRGTMPASQVGLYRLTDGTLSAVAAVGALNPKEASDMRATERVLAPVARASGGGVHWLADGLPELRRVGANARATGDGWIGLRETGSYRVSAIGQRALLPPWLALLLLAGTMVWAWRREGR